MRRTSAIVFFLGLYLLAAQIGDTLKQSLTIFSIFVWGIAAGMLAYLILFRDVKLKLFSKESRPNRHYEDLEQDWVKADEPELSQRIDSIDAGAARRLPNSD